jgi:crotonobetainyl-CoA:carnitine CoA-transferase CaiB-like acyl-CoA transferase
VFRTKDGWLLVQVAGNSMFRRWAGLVGRGDLVDAPGFASDVERGDNGTVLSDIMRDWCASRTTAECLVDLRGARLPASEVLSPAQTLEDPARTQADWCDTTMVCTGASAPVATPPISLSGTRQAFVRPAPRLGEHTEEVLRELEYTDTEIRDLIEEQVVADRKV